jgi:hypothetical protein
MTLLAAGIAGFLVWLATRIGEGSTGGYWAVYAIIAGAGLVLGLSQAARSLTGAGRALLSPSVLVFAFLPALIAVGWIAVAGQPHGNTVRSHVLEWSGDLGIRGTVRDLLEYLAVLAFGLGAVLGLSLVPAAVREVPPAEVRDWRTDRTVVRPSGPVGAGAVEERRPVGVTNGERAD